MSSSFFATALLPLALFVIMTGLGLSLTVADFKRVMVYPRGVFIGLGNLLLMSPLLAFLAAVAYQLPPELAVGMLLLGAAPGGTTANLLTHLARGDTALSVTMTAVSSLAAVVTTPIVLALATAHFLGTQTEAQLDMVRIVLRVLTITVVPLSIGMALRAYAPAFAAQAEPWVKRAALGFFAIVVAGAMYEARNEALGMLLAVGAATLTLNLAAMGLSWFIARRAKLDLRQSTAIAIELGVHNTTLTMAVGAMIAPVYMIPGAVYGIQMLFTAGAFVWFIQRRNAAETKALPL
jgi:bile acid:Na+ symporter, BASS family